MKALFALLLPFVIQLTACTKQPEFTSTELLLSASGACSFSFIITDQTGKRVKDQFDCSWSKVLSLKLAPGHYIISADTGFGRVVHLEFDKKPGLQELEIQF